MSSERNNGSAKRKPGRPKGSKNKSRAKAKATKTLAKSKAPVKVKRKAIRRPPKYATHGAPLHPTEPIVSVEDTPTTATPTHSPSEHFYTNTMPDAPSRIVKRLADEAKVVHFVKSLAGLTDALDKFCESLEGASQAIRKMESNRK